MPLRNTQVILYKEYEVDIFDSDMIYVILRRNTQVILYKEHWVDIY